MKSTFLDILSKKERRILMNRLIIAFLLALSFIQMVLPLNVLAQTETSKEDLLKQRMSLYVQFEDMLVPWYFLAAIDQYERNIQAVRKDIPSREGVVAIRFSDEYWAGPFNPLIQDNSPTTIDYFGGMGLDGDKDGVADAENDIDIIYTMASYLSHYGPSEADFKKALWDYYTNETIVNQVLAIASLYKKYQDINLEQYTFPVALGYNYTFKGTWGANRGWGGRRIHEGTDIFADYGTPVLSASYGVVVTKGWNKFGGWRIGIRDHHNSYHYYAHLSSYAKGIEVGDIVKPGTVIGYVGSSGYGSEGTSGKFPPHLHYGIYKFNGRYEWAYDPYPSLLQWERTAKAQLKKN